MSPSHDPYEIGKIVASLDNLKESVQELKNDFRVRLDIILRETVSRREYDSLSKDVDNIGSELRKMKTDSDKQSWVPDLIRAAITIVASGLVAYFIK